LRISEDTPTITVMMTVSAMVYILLARVSDTLVDNYYYRWNDWLMFYFVGIFIVIVVALYVRNNLRTWLWAIIAQIFAVIACCIAYAHFEEFYSGYHSWGRMFLFSMAFSIVIIVTIIVDMYLRRREWIPALERVGELEQPEPDDRRPHKIRIPKR
jgi:peptidoglycan/LPS O-acetylase OafA/YrhL